MSESFAPGAPVTANMIPLCVPQISGREWDYVKDCLDTGWVSSVGSYVDRFEQMLAGWTGSKYAIATVNGTAALHIALLVAGVQPDDEVITSDLTFIAPANAIRYVGAYPVFIDADPAYWQMDPARLADFLHKDCHYQQGQLRNKATGRQVSALLPVHVLGHPVDIEPLVTLARQFNLKVIEDATEALGTRYKNRPAGSFGDIACFSFNGNKLITTGGGGMIVTDQPALAKQAKYLTTQAKDDPVEYIHSVIGYNYRLTNVLAAIGCAQMEQLESFVDSKRETAEFYRTALADVPGITYMPEADWAHSSFWMYTVLIDETRFGMSSRGLLRALSQAGIQARPLWQPMHQSKVFAGLGSWDCPVSERLNATALSLPCSVGVTRAQLAKVCERIAQVARSAQ
jgi:perosamine synthetase